MEGTRRSFFATLFAAAGATAIAATAPVKPKPTGGTGQLKALTSHGRMSSAEYRRAFDRAMERFPIESFNSLPFFRLLQRSRL